MIRIVGILLAGTALLPSAALAETVTADTHGSNEATQPGDIVVTAQRYEQRIQDVPLAITAVSGDQIKARNAQSIKDLQYSVPGLSLFSYGVGQDFTQLRGVSNLNGASTVGMYFDETPLVLDAQGNDINIKLMDIERVEVLAGPQATLYGQGSMGGTIRYIPATPDLGRASGSIDTQWSATKDGANNADVTGMVNLPIVTDMIGLRIAGDYERIGGWIDAPLLDEKDINKADIYSIRATLRLKPSERLDISILGTYQKSKQGNQNFGVGGTTTERIRTPANDRIALIQGKASYDLDFATLSGSASYIDRRLSTTFDITSFYLPYLPAFGVPDGTIDSIALAGLQTNRIFNSELRLASQGKGSLRWALGATFRNLKTDYDVSTPTTPVALPFDLLSEDQRSKNKSYAIYGELSYAFTPKLKATVGLRYYREDKHQTTASTNFGASTLDINNGIFDTVNPRFNISYTFSRNAMVYANVAKGFRSGGFNLTSAGLGVYRVPPTYDPDEIWTYEVGTKQSLFDGKLILDASGYRSVWSKVQSYAFAPGSSITITTNSGHVSGWGVDFSASARPTKALTLTGTFGWNNLAYDTTTVDKVAGDPVDGAVRQSWSLSIDYRPQLTDDITGIFRIDYQHAGKAMLVIRNFVPELLVPRPSRNLVGARIGAAFDHIELSIFADNLFNVRTPSIVGPFGVISENVEQRPRVLGVSASAKF